MKSLKNLKGFTLLELLIVVVILAILAGLALPQYFRTVGRARESEGWQTMATLRSALGRYYAEFNDFTGVDTTLLDIEDPNATTTPPRLFSYTITAAGPYNFTVSASPEPNCGNCRTLSVDQDGTRTP